MKATVKDIEDVIKDMSLIIMLGHNAISKEYPESWKRHQIATEALYDHAKSYSVVIDKMEE